MIHLSFGSFDCSIGPATLVCLLRALSLHIAHTCSRACRPSPGPGPGSANHQTTPAKMFGTPLRKLYWTDTLERNISTAELLNLYCLVNMCHLYMIYFMRCGDTLWLDSLCKKAKGRKDHVPCFDKEVKQVAQGCCCCSPTCNSAWGCIWTVVHLNVQVQTWRTMKPGSFPAPPHPEHLKAEEELKRLTTIHTGCLAARKVPMPSPDD